MKKKTLWVSLFCVINLTVVASAQPLTDGSPFSAKDAEKPILMHGAETSKTKTHPSDFMDAHSIPFRELPAGNPASRAEPSTLTLEEKMYFDEQSRLKREISIMEARVKLAEQQAKLNEATTMGMASKPMVAQPASLTSVLTELTNKETTTNNPAQGFILVSVYGVNENLEGEVFYRGGRIQVRPGDKLPGGFLVSSIEPTRIIITKGKRKSEINLGHPSSTN